MSRLVERSILLKDKTRSSASRPGDIGVDEPMIQLRRMLVISNEYIAPKREVGMESSWSELSLGSGKGVLMALRDLGRRMLLSDLNSDVRSIVLRVSCR